MIHIFKKSSTRTLLYTLAGEHFLHADRFADEVSDTLRYILPMKELFVTYVDIVENSFSFHHGPEVSSATVSFYKKYPQQVLPADYMARTACNNAPGRVIIDAEAMDERSELDMDVARRSLAETGIDTMALCLLTAPSDFSKAARRMNPFLQTGVTALTLYGGRNDDRYTERDKKRIQKHMFSLRMGALNSRTILHGKADFPRIREKSVFTLV